MVNPWRGDVEIVLDGERHLMRLTLGALAELELALGADNLIALAERFEGAAFTSRDVLAVIVAGLRGGGWSGSSAELMHVQIEGGPLAAARAAADLLARAFMMPSEG
ncbi:gene transfer agent protein [Roseivivax halodurans JCM 10272]|uniref:Gene transfer agent protein n=1 Tax=Roseivivax halodurans JCM 10272 TaxID=1449350 RepID=X7EJR2_9RHOB|nr:gene transfer agent family protein [Roseivivax halodurans]ETX16167.1 gene transfer agent protein [Roseivivax halodurans JCM 10272]